MRSRKIVAYLNADGSVHSAGLSPHVNHLKVVEVPTRVPLEAGTATVRMKYQGGIGGPVVDVVDELGGQRSSLEFSVEVPTSVLEYHLRAPDPSFDIDIELCDGKYHVLAGPNMTNLRALRYGEKWRDLTGDKFVLALCHRIRELEHKLEQEQERASI